MKNNQFAFLSHLRSYTFIMILMLLAVGCHNEERYKIGISQCSDDDWRRKMNGEILREMMFHPEAQVEIRSANDDNAKQIADLEYFVNNHFDIIIVAPNEAEALTPVIKNIYDKGIPVIVFDRTINGDYYTAFQGADNVGIGSAAARQALTIFPDGPSVLEVQGLSGSTPAQERHSGFYTEFCSHADSTLITTVYSDWTYEDAFTTVQEILSVTPAPDVIYAHNDRMAIAARTVCDEIGIHPYIIGIDAAPEIGMQAVQDGLIDATFLYPTEGAALVKTALGVLAGEPFEKVSIISSSTPLTHDNVAVLLMQNEELESETRHMEQLKEQLDEYWEKHTAQSVMLVAVIIILILAFVVIFVVIRAVWIHKKHRQELSLQNRQLAQQKEELESQKNELISLNRQLEDATQSKLMFFTNVSHDLRTPITLISEPVAQLATSSNLTTSQRSLLRIADKNIRILRRLINQILDFRKYENHKLQLNLIEINLAKALEEWLSAFESLAQQRHIKLTLSSPQDVLIAIDVEKIERVFFNLVSNAFKYSPDNTSVTIECRVSAENVSINVSDQGRGISADDVPNVFDRFFQVDRVHPTGSGIGLSLAKAFVELHGGTISVESELHHGSVFTVVLPLRHVADRPVAIVNSISEDDVNAELGIVEHEDSAIDVQKPVLLVIDDNKDILHLINELLGDEYNIITADNGKSGVKKAVKYVPDVIICDVMMPVMDGLECTRAIKEEVSTSHIPVLMLTACSMDEQRVQGYDSGADGYLAKPFNTDVLKAQLRNLIRTRRQIENLWRGVEARPGTTTENSTAAKAETLKKASSTIDNDFYRKFVEIVNRKMSDPDMSVDVLASELGLARSQFYRKIKALTGYSPVELVRQMRLKKARALLTTTEMTISEIGYGVGFSSAAYFSKCFHDEFGETPSDLRERL